jgi:hypothetical protein
MSAIIVAFLSLVFARLPFLGAGEEREPTIIAQGSYRITDERDGPLTFLGNLGETKELVLGSRAELAKAVPKGTEPEKAEARLCKLLGVKEIDWTKQMLIAFSPGYTRAQWTIEFHSIRKKDRSLTIGWKASFSGAEALGVGKSRPVGLALVDKFDGAVFFDPKDWTEPLR